MKIIYQTEHSKKTLCGISASLFLFRLKKSKGTYQIPDDTRFLKIMHCHFRDSSIYFYGGNQDTVFSFEECRFSHVNKVRISTLGTLNFIHNTIEKESHFDFSLMNKIDIHFLPSSSRVNYDIGASSVSLSGNGENTTVYLNLHHQFVSAHSLQNARLWLGNVDVITFFNSEVQVDRCHYQSMVLQNSKLVTKEVQLMKNTKMSYSTIEASSSVTLPYGTIVTPANKEAIVLCDTYPLERQENKEYVILPYKTFSEKTNQEEVVFQDKKLALLSLLYILNQFNNYTLTEKVNQLCEKYFKQKENYIQECREMIHELENDIVFYKEEVSKTYSLKNEIHSGMAQKILKKPFKDIYHS